MQTGRHQGRRLGRVLEAELVDHIVCHTPTIPESEECRPRGRRVCGLIANDFRRKAGFLDDFPRESVGNDDERAAARIATGEEHDSHEPGRDKE
jgi:hypothetical protein